MTNHEYLTMEEFARRFALSVRSFQRLLKEIDHKRKGGKVSPEEQQYLRERIHQYELKKLREQESRNRGIEESRNRGRLVLRNAKERMANDTFGQIGAIWRDLAETRFGKGLDVCPANLDFLYVGSNSLSLRKFFDHEASRHFAKCIFLRHLAFFASD